MLDKLLLMTAIIGSLAALFNIIGVSLYDLSMVKVRRAQQLHPHAARYRRRPLVSVIVSTDKDEKSLPRCLNSLLSSNYRNIEIIVLVNETKGQTHQTFNEFINKHPKRLIKLAVGRKSDSYIRALRRAYKNNVNGQLVMLINSSLSLEKQALSRAVNHFNTNDKLDVLNINYKVVKGTSIGGLFQEFRLLLATRAQKAQSSLNVSYFSASDQSAVYSKQIMAKLLTGSNLSSPVISLGNKSLRLDFASDVIGYLQPLSLPGLVKSAYLDQIRHLKFLIRGRQAFFSNSSSYSKFFSWFWLPFKIAAGLAMLTVPVIVVFFTYLAFRLHEPAFLVVCWVVLALIILSAIWDDEQLSWFQKSRLILLMPVTYCWFYILAIIQYFALLSGLIVYNRIEV